jgi:hypothetical protein
VVAAVAASTVSLCGLVIALYQASLARRSADRAWRVFELQRRPWLTTRLQTTGLQFDATSGRWTWRLVAKIVNYGQSGAVRVCPVLVADSLSNRSAYADAPVFPSDVHNQVPPGWEGIPVNVTVVLDSSSMACLQTGSEMYLHVCLDYEGAETGLRYYQELVFLAASRVDSPQSDSSTLTIREDAVEVFFGTVVNDTVRLSTRARPE